MKKFIKQIGIALCLIIAASFVLIACDDSTPKGLTYSGSALAAGTIGTPYTASVAAAEGADDITYELKLGSWLPTGLELSEAGAITGTPGQVIADHKFTVIAVSEKADAEKEAEFTMTVNPGSFTFTGGALADGTTGVFYSASVAITGADAALYAYTLEGTLPEGLNFSGGMVTGVPKKASVVANHAFTVKASRANYADKSAEFTITVLDDPHYVEDELADVITYVTFDLPVGAVNQPYSANLATATGTGGNAQYQIDFSITGTGFPEGIDFENGVIVGIPADSTSMPPVTVAGISELASVPNDLADYNQIGYFAFEVIASGKAGTPAAGLTPVRVLFKLKIEDAKVITNRFEAELTDVDCKKGGGWSNSVSGREVIQFADSKATASEPSNGAWISHTNGIRSIDFVIESSAAATAALVMSLSHENDGAAYTKGNNFLIRVNTVDIDFESFFVSAEDGGGGVIASFRPYSFTGIALREGINVISLIVTDVNEVWGPEMDYIELTGVTNEAQLSWRPRVANMNRT